MVTNLFKETNETIRERLCRPTAAQVHDRKVYNKRKLVRQFVDKQRRLNLITVVLSVKAT